MGALDGEASDKVEASIRETREMGIRKGGSIREEGERTSIRIGVTKDTKTTEGVDSTKEGDKVHNEKKRKRK